MHTGQQQQVTGRDSADRLLRDTAAVGANAVHHVANNLMGGCEQADDATFKSPMMSSTSTTPTSSDLASLIYSSIILDYLQLNSNIKVNFCKSIVRKFY